ncbi:integrase core domain-containing protein [Halomonas mongoliensis]|uniref:integrase core domain-containing protein n=1 Tax=Halomonas mongoliensis TaxID=321265 RepID=UPI00403AFED2
MVKRYKARRRAVYHAFSLQHRFESLGQARAVIRRWIRYYNEERPNQSLGYVAPRAHPALAA